MDKVRFGRALGSGARAAAKSLMEAADAATAPDPRASKVPAPASNARPQNSSATTQARPHAPSTSAQALANGGKQATKGLFGSVRKFSSVLWLEVMGTFFGVMVVVLLEGAWKLHKAWFTGTGLQGDRGMFVLVLVLALMFGYFSVSNFVRANRRGKRA